MRQTTKLLFLAAALAAVVIGAPAVFARNDAPQNANLRKERKAFDDSQIPQEQRAKLRELREKFKTEGKALREALKTKRQALMKELESEKLDRGAVDKLSGEVKELQAKLIDHRIAGILAMREIVGPEKLKAFREHRRKHRGGERQKRRGRPEKDYRQAPQ